MRKMVLYLLLLSQFCYCHIIETERTIWYPWTITHSEEWELLEKNDSTISYYRRNNYFESMEELILRDHNWLRFTAYANKYFGENTIFPNLGFAIIRKTDHKLIGTIIIKISDLAGHLSFGYALIPDVRNHKLGQEIIRKLISLNNEFINHNVATFIDENTKNKFVKAWYDEGKKQNPDWEYLLSFFKQKSTPYLGLTASVDVSNKASLAVLVRNGMQPYEMVCDRYIVDQHVNLFSFDFHLKYPALQKHITQFFENMILDLLSRDINRIASAEQSIRNLFAIPNDWSYLQINRDEKAQLHIQEKMSSTIPISSTDTKKHIHYQCLQAPYCFIH